MTKSTQFEVVRPSVGSWNELALAACARAGKDVDRGSLPQGKTIVGVDMLVRLVGQVTFADPVVASGSIPWQDICAGLVRYLHDTDPGALADLAQQMEAELENIVSDLDRARAKDMFSRCRGPAVWRAGAMAGKVECELLEVYGVRR